MKPGSRTGAVVVPVKPLHLAKSRLASALDAAERAKLAASMASHVIRIATASGKLVVVVTSDPLVAARARGVSAIVAEDPSDSKAYGFGTPQALNRSLTHGINTAESRGAEEVLVLPADLPFLAVADVLDAAVRPGRDGVAIAPSARGGGTNALALPLPVPFELAFGPESFDKHVSSAFRAGVPVRVTRRWGLVHDVDTPEEAKAFQEVATRG